MIFYVEKTAIQTTHVQVIAILTDITKQEQVSAGSALLNIGFWNTRQTVLRARPYTVHTW